MIIPRNIIYWFALLLPLSAAAPHGDGFMLLLLASAGFILLLAVADAVMVVGQADKISVATPPLMRFSMNRESSIPFTVMNPGRCRNEFYFSASFPEELGVFEQGLRFRLDAVEQVVYNCECLPVNRGQYRIENAMFEMKSPLGLWSFRKKNPLDGEARVYPDTHSEKNTLAAIFLNSSLSGLHLHRMVGQGREFEKMRDYVPGDSFDIISWKATAKRGKPVCKEYQVERTQEVYVIIDTSRFSAKSKNGISNLDHHFSSALVLGQVTEKQGDLFGVITFDDQVRTFIRAKGGKAHYSACRDAIYAISSQNKSPDFEALFAFIRTKLRRRSLLMFLTDLDERSLAEQFVDGISLVSKQHLCMVNMLKDEKLAPLFERRTENHGEIYDHLGGHAKWADLLEIKHALTRYGVHFSMIGRDKLSIHMISNYLDMKRRQLI